MIKIGKLIFDDWKYVNHNSTFIKKVSSGDKSSDLEIKRGSSEELLIYFPPVSFESNYVIKLFELIHGDEFWKKLNFDHEDSLKESIDSTLKIAARFKAFL